MTIKTERKSEKAEERGKEGGLSSKSLRLQHNSKKTKYLTTRKEDGGIS